MRALILSAELSTLDPQTNAQRTRHLKALLSAFEIPHRQALGRYKGIDEISYLIPTRPETASSDLALILELAKRFDQESVLDLNETCATLRDQNGVPIASLSLIEESLTPERPEGDHTAVETNGGYLVLKFA